MKENESDLLCNVTAKFSLRVVKKLFTCTLLLVILCFEMAWAAADMCVGQSAVAY